MSASMEWRCFENLLALFRLYKFVVELLRLPRDQVNVLAVRALARFCQQLVDLAIIVRAVHQGNNEVHGFAIALEGLHVGAVERL